MEISIPVLITIILNYVNDTILAIYDCFQSWYYYWNYDFWNSQIRQYDQNRDIFWSGFNFKKRLKLLHYSLFSNIIIILLIFTRHYKQLSVPVQFMNGIYSEIHTRITKNWFKGFGPDVTLSVSYSQITVWN